MQNKIILINSTSHETRAAVLSQGNISELFLERSRKRTLVGNIYKGKVVKVLPGMQSAFVDIGLHKAAFLHVADIHTDISDIEDESEEYDDIVPTETSFPPIEDLLHEGQEIIIQVAKDATGNKGARLTMHLSLAGRHLVLMPNYSHIGVSRKIEDEDERDKLRDILKTICPAEHGLIARTVSKGQNIDDLVADRDYLLRIWAKVCESAAKSGAPKLVYEDDNLIFRILRDVVSEDTSELIIDNESDYNELLQFCKDYLPELEGKITLYNKPTPLFDAYNVELEINRVLDKKIWLRSGGYIIIDPTEALTVIDVNTGKFVGKRNFEETILKTNIEAAREIAHQLKLRNIGGIIIVDFIDMEVSENKTKVLNLLDELLREDRARASVVNITPLGLVEITRKRAQESVIRLMSEPCPYCEGRGVIKSRLTVCYDILRMIRRIGPESKGKRLLLEAHNEVADILLSNERESLDALEKDFDISIEVQFRPNFHLENYEIIPLNKR
ncbi:MAG: Rne/Rng family ribonuclease [Deferribacteraceae bacterium]|jgi:ribonuclease G|nr:Rne/Rng family ribonuclease [Deferribacteraceae bacterium]